MMLLTLVLVLGSLGGSAAWWSLRPDPPLPTGGDQAYQDIPRTEYEQWMQDLGYVD